MSTTASQITSLTIVYSIVYSAADQKSQSAALLDFVKGIQLWPVNSRTKVTRKIFPFDGIIVDFSCVVLNDIIFQHHSDFGRNSQVFHCVTDSLIMTNEIEYHASIVTMGC